MFKRSPVHIALVVTIVAGLLALNYATIPTQKHQGAEALERVGFHDAELHVSLLTYCAKGRTGWAWRTKAAHGQVCTGGLLPPSVSVWR